MSTIYGETIVNKVLIGKQYSRVIRCHTLALLAIVKKIISMCELDVTFKSTLEDLKYFAPDSIDELVESSEFKSSVEHFEKIFERIEMRNSTCKLWITY